jgi:hypothetical protein
MSVGRLSTSLKEVSGVWKFDSGLVPVPQWHISLGASGLPVSILAASRRDIAVSGAVFGTGPSAAAMPAVRRHRIAAAALAAAPLPVGVPAPAGALAPAGDPVVVARGAKLGRPASNQKQIEKQYVTSGNALGIGAAGPPRRCGPA